jgi:hypothetical protein
LTVIIVESLAVGRVGQGGVRGCDAADGARREVWDGRGRPVNRRRQEDQPQPAEILFCDAPLLVFWPGSRTEIRPEYGKGEGLVNSAKKPPDREGQRRS